MSYIFLPPSGGSIYYENPVATSTDLPSGEEAGTIAVVLDTGLIYYYTGAAWAVIASRTLISGTAPVSYNSTTGAISMAAATSGANGYLTSADWTTFNGKEGAITSGTTAQFWRGDKSFQTLNVAAMTAEIAATAASTGKIGEILTASQASNTTTNVGSTGTYGAATSLSLTAGVWQVQGVAGFNENGANLTTALECGISASSTGSGISEFDTALMPFQVSSTSDALVPTPVVYVNISSTTTYYLNTRFYYSAGTPQHRGKITALRIR